MSPEVRYACINRLRDRVDRGADLAYPQAKHDLNLVFGELERVQADNAHLRIDHAQLWSLANSPERATTRRGRLLELAAWLAVAITWTVAVIVALRNGTCCP